MTEEQREEYLNTLSFTLIKNKGTTVSIKNQDGLFIPLDENNSDYKDYLDWVEAGNTPAEESI